MTMEAPRGPAGLEPMVYVEPCPEYDPAGLDAVLARWEHLFTARVRPGHTVVLKPNWISSAHKYDESQWEAVITNPAVITSVLGMVLKCLDGRGRVVIADAPQTQASWRKIMARMTPERWMAMGARAGVEVVILDLRDHEWLTRNDVIVERTALPGDPLGSTECDLSDFSEFVGHRPGSRGYFGADYDVAETNRVHSNGHHKYRVSRTVVSADVFVNLPKMKTHKKAGITCSLKNLVGINTYKNWLPHHSEGTPADGGDQFPHATVKSRAETHLLEAFRRVLVAHAGLARWLTPVKSLGRSVLGDTRDVIRSGNWYGNQTLWRMVLDLNKILLYANPDGSLRPGGPSSAKPYISVVDGIVAGEGNGPEAPDARPAGLLLAGTNPVTTDALCARLMGFDWQKIPTIRHAFEVGRFALSPFAYEEILAVSTLQELTGPLDGLMTAGLSPFRPHFGWREHIER